MTPSVKQLAKLFKSGKSIPDIARIYDVSSGKMNYHANLLGFKRSISEARTAKTNCHDRRGTLLSESILRKLYEIDRLSTYEIAEKCGRNRDAVVRALHRFGIHVRRSVPVTWSHKLLMRKLREQGIKIDEFQINYQAVGTRYLIDIAFPEIKLAVEVDGRSHFEDSDGYFGKRREYDLIRDAELISLHWSVVHFTDHDIRYRLDEIVTELGAQIWTLTQEREASEISDDDIVRHSEEIRRS
jgi:very-short-patch-repair endonuclease